MTTTEQRDVVQLLLDQHEQIRTLFADVENATGDRKRALFEELVRLLAVHESAEEVVVHPRARREIRSGDDIVGARLEEEHDAKESLVSLYNLGVEHPTFDRRLAELGRAVSEHAANEEAEEFRYLRENVPPERLRRMAGAVEVAESMAPSRPHPRAGSSAMANAIGGPPLALFDRLRDGVRDWRRSHDGD
jgi:hemerythrin superfamily protein